MKEKRLLTQDHFTFKGTLYFIYILNTNLQKNTHRIQHEAVDTLAG